MLVTMLAVGGILATLTSQVQFNYSRKALNIGLLRQEVSRTALQMEAATRDYILTHDSRYLELYRDGEERLPDLWDRMTVAVDSLEGTGPNSSSQLRPLVAELKSSIESWKDTWADAQVSRSAQATPVAASDAAGTLLG